MIYKRELDKIIGKTIISVDLDKGSTEFSFKCDRGDRLEFRVTADCCSESWIELFTLPKLPAKILSIEERDLPAPPDSGRQGNDQAYSTVFKTDQGDLEIEYRNSSNGYYGGSLEFVG